MSTFTVGRLATPDEVAAEMDRRGAVIEKLETDLRHWREECGKLHARIATMTSGGVMLEWPEWWRDLDPRDRIRESGGTLSYICDVQEQIRVALSRIPAKGERG